MTYLELLALVLDGSLLLLAAELGVAVRLVRLIDLVPRAVDLRLELVLALLGVGDELVLADHLAFLLGVLVLDLVRERSGARRDGQIALADLLLDLAGLLRGRLGLAVGGLVVGLHRLFRSQRRFSLGAFGRTLCISSFG